MHDLWSRMNPALAGLVRGLVVAVVTAALAAAAAYAGSVQVPEGAPFYVGIALIALTRFLEGVYDKWRERTGRSVEAPAPHHDLTRRA